MTSSATNGCVSICRNRGPEITGTRGRQGSWEMLRAGRAHRPPHLSLVLKAALGNELPQQHFKTCSPFLTSLYSLYPNTQPLPKVSWLSETSLISSLLQFSHPTTSTLMYHITLVLWEQTLFIWKDLKTTWSSDLLLHMCLKTKHWTATVCQAMF